MTRAVKKQMQTKACPLKPNAWSHHGTPHFNFQPINNAVTKSETMAMVYVNV